MPHDPIPGLSAIAAEYDALLCDVWGVLHNGVRASPGAAEALAEFRRRGPVVLMTNAPRPSGPVIEQLEALGIPRSAYDAIVSSGDVVRRHLVEEGFARAYHVGAGRDLPLYEDTAIAVVEQPEEADVAVLASVRQDRTERAEDYRDEMAKLVALGLPLVCANPDIVVERDGILLPCAGALALLAEELGGAVRQFGKPHAPIYQTALEEVRRRAPEASRALVVGDGLPTDITGANRHGFDALFITDGIHADEVGVRGTPDPARVAERLAAERLVAAHVATRLSW
jgi:HAD superfamily hydrolase (TIGR01459 family)